MTTHATITTKFFDIVGSNARNAILDHIAKHYGVTRAAILEEVTAPEAECLLDYIEGPQRAATLALFIKHRINPFAPVEA